MRLAFACIWPEPSAASPAALSQGRKPLLLFAILWTLATAASSASASPLPTRDQNPFLAAFGLPGALDARMPERPTWALDFNWGSTALVQNAANEFLVVDAETREVRLSFARRIAERWSLELQITYRSTTGGTLDSFIDDWHDALGLPEGARRIQPQDRLRLHYWRDDATLIELGTQTEGLADASVSLAYALHTSNESAVSAAIAVKLPAGKDHWLNSSGAVDVSAIVTAERQLGERWRLDGQLAATWLGEGELLPHLQRDLVWSGRAGLSFALTPALDVGLQVDGHTRAFDSDLEFFDDALIATLGGHITFGSGWTFTLGVSEDIMVEHSPDVVFVIGLAKQDAL